MTALKFKKIGPSRYYAQRGGHAYEIDGTPEGWWVMHCPTASINQGQELDTVGQYDTFADAKTAAGADLNERDD